MKHIQIFKGKVVCPRCDGNGLIYRIPIMDTNESLYVCDECEACWKTIEEIINNEFKDLTTFLDERNINISDYSHADFDWQDDLETKSNYYSCPLLNILIWMGDCYDINAYGNKIVKKTVLSGLEQELRKNFEIKEIEKICSTCKHSWWAAQ